MIINHITYSVSEISEAVLFYNKLFRKIPVAIGEKLAYYDLDGLWFALNLVSDLRVESYNHIAFFTDDMTQTKMYLDSVGIDYTSGRNRHRDEFDSVYIRDHDKNLIEFHTGNLMNRLTHYKKSRKDIKIREDI